MVVMLSQPRAWIAPLRRFALRTAAGFAVCALLAAAAFGQFSLSVNPQEIRLAAPAGSATPAVQTLTILSAGQNVSFTASARQLGTDVEWLSVAPAAGTTPAALNVSASAAGLSAGTYVGQIVIQAGTLGGFANVVFTVGAAQRSGTLSVSPTALTFLAQAGSGALAPQTLTVMDSSGAPGQFTATASSSGNWLSVVPSGSGTLSVMALANGSDTRRTGTITITPAGGGSPLVVPVVLARTGVTQFVMNLSQHVVTFVHQIGTPPPPIQVVDTVSSVIVDYTAVSDSSWLRLISGLNQIPSGAVTDRAPGAFGVVINPAGLAAGKYTGTVTVTSPSQPAQILPVSLTVTPHPGLNVEPSSITFSNIDGIDVTGARGVLVTSTGISSLSFIASSNASWLQVTPTSGVTGTGGQSLTISTSAIGVPSGSYLGAITLTVQGTGESTEIPIRFFVSGASAGDLEVNTEPVSLTALAGGSNPYRTVYVTSLSAATVDFTAAAVSSGWLSVEPFSGTIPGRRTVPLTIRADNSAVPRPGTYSGQVVVTSLGTGDIKRIPVTFNLSMRAVAAEPASLTFTQTRRGETPAPQTVLIRSNAAGSFVVANRPEWVSVTPASGSTPATLTVSVNPAGLPPGVNTGTISVRGPDNTIEISVSLAIPELPAPVVTPPTVTLSYDLGSPAPSLPAISVASTGDPFPFTATLTTDPPIPWLKVSPLAGTVPATLAAAVDTALLAPGQHKATLRIVPAEGATASGAATLTVTLDVRLPRAAVQLVLHGATQSATPLAPGQLITITGAGLGPATGESAVPTAAGAVETRLAGVRVLFDGIPAPLLFARVDQIRAIVPYALHGRASARIQVESGTAYSVPIEVKVVDAAPGLFTAGGSGRGQAAALNADQTPNSVLNPAARGGVISVFGTGEGQTDPPGQDGRIISFDVRRPLLPASARIGGRPAVIEYLGSASGQVSGVFQANIRIPEDLEPGVAQVELQFGEASTQPGVTIAIR